jgi:hypothetical protein
VEQEGSHTLSRQAPCETSYACPKEVRHVAVPDSLVEGISCPEQWLKPMCEVSSYTNPFSRPVVVSIPECVFNMSRNNRK